MKYIELNGALFALLLSAAVPSFAQSNSSGQFNTNASVASTCTVSSGSWTAPAAINTVSKTFGEKNINSANQKITVTCTQGTPLVTVRRDSGLNTACKQNGLYSKELLMKAGNGDFLPYSIYNGAGTPWLCNNENNQDPQLNFNTTYTQEFEFILEAGVWNNSVEANRLFNTARAGTYTDTITFSVEF